MFKGRRAKRARPYTGVGAHDHRFRHPHHYPTQPLLREGALGARSGCAVVPEEPHAPLLHRLATQRNEGGTVPVLVHGSRRFMDSTAILVHADAVCGGDLLYPRDAALGR